MYENSRNFRVPKEIGVEEHHGDVRFKTGSGNMTVSCIRNASGHNYRNSSFTVDLAMGQIPRSTERISSFTQPRLACQSRLSISDTPRPYGSLPWQLGHRLSLANINERRPYSNGCLDLKYKLKSRPSRSHLASQTDTA